MKALFKKNLIHIILGILIAVYESASALNALPFEIPTQAKKWIGFIAIIGLIVKNYKR